MGKGDLRSRRGKIYNGSHGKTRPGRAPKKDAAPATPAPARTPGRK
jgi:30S ribosomal protein S31